MKKFQTVIEVGNKTQTLHFYNEEEHIGHSKEERHIGLIEYHLENTTIKIDLIFVHQSLEGKRFGSNLLQYFIENIALKLHLPITGICISEASIHLFYNMKKRYPTIIRNMQISYEKCVCHYCKNQIKFLDQLEITDLYYKHMKGKCPSYQEEPLMLGLYTGSERMNDGRSRVFHRSHCSDHPRNRDIRRRKNQYYKELYDDIDSIKRQKEREKKRWRSKIEEKRHPHFIHKKSRSRRVTIEEFTEIYVNQYGESPTQVHLYID